MKVIEYSAGGTIGDVYVHVCRLYHKAKTEKIRVYHYTRHHFWNGLIQRIYYILPNVGVAFCKPPKALPGLERMRPEYFPDFNRFSIGNARLHWGLPEEFVAVCMKSGRPTQGYRRIKPQVMDEIVEKHRTVVLLGDDTPDPYTNKNVIDLRGRTPIYEAFWCAANCTEFYGFQGCLTFVALSQRVPTTVYIAKDDDKVAVKGNILTTPWNQYCKGVIE